MTSHILTNKNGEVTVISSREFISDDTQAKSTPIDKKDLKIYDQLKSEVNTNINLAYVCNWNQKCGISTYSEFLFDNLRYQVDSYKILSETPSNDEQFIQDDNIVYCWKRGQKLGGLLDEIKKSNANFVLIQHEWGLFQNQRYFMQFIIELNNLGIKYALILHSVYRHLDKTIPLSIVKNVIVHSDECKDVLTGLSLPTNVYVIPHGCPDISEESDLWNIFQNPYTIFGYGFGFAYKGVDMAIDAINYLHKTDPKFQNILYIYICSESDNNKGIHNAYYESLQDKVKSYGLEDNILLIKGFMPQELISNYLRVVKMVLFPYVYDDNNMAYGASGAIKIAMSYNQPVIASYSHLFDDIDGVVPKVTDYVSLAKEIDKIFSNAKYRKELVDNAHEYIKENSWTNVTNIYIDSIKNILK